MSGRRPGRYSRHDDAACERRRVHVDSVHRGCTDEEADRGGACAAAAAREGHRVFHGSAGAARRAPTIARYGRGEPWWTRRRDRAVQRPASQPGHRPRAQRDFARRRSGGQLLRGTDAETPQTGTDRAGWTAAAGAAARPALRNPDPGPEVAPAGRRAAFGSSVITRHEGRAPRILPTWTRGAREFLMQDRNGSEEYGQLRARIDNGAVRIATVGSGYIGTVIAAVVADRGYDVTSIDIRESTIDQLNRGHTPINEPGLAELVRRTVEAGRLRGSTDLAAA